MATTGKQQASSNEQPQATHKATNSVLSTPSLPAAELAPAASATNKTPKQHQHQQHKTTTSGANALSPNAALEQAGGGCQQRRRSTLSANGFFIDYSCTRRRSSAALHHQQARANPKADPLTSNQFIRNVISPVRRPSAMIAGSMSGGGGGAGGGGGPRESFSAAGPRAVHSRASYSTGSTAGLLQPPLMARHPRLSVGSVGARSMAGSRKTSIFDPTGHSLAAIRRKSTMVMASGGGSGGSGGSGGGVGLPMAPAVEQAATMLAVSRQAAALQRAGKRQLVERVPVIGCSPTSIRSSLAALKETRRYEKLLRKLKQHQKRKQKERVQLVDDDDDELMCDIDLESDGSDESGSSFGSSDSDHANNSDRHYQHQHHHSKHQMSMLRRKSLRAIRDVSMLLNKASVMQKRRRRRKRRWRMNSSHRADSFVDGLSISSTLSFASSQTSLASIDRFLGELSLYEYDEEEDDDDDYEEDGEGYFSEGHDDKRGPSGESADQHNRVCGGSSTRLDAVSNHRVRRCSARNDNELDSSSALGGRNNTNNTRVCSEKSGCDYDEEAPIDWRPQQQHNHQRQPRQDRPEMGPIDQTTTASQTPSNNNNKGSLVRKAMKRIAATLGTNKQPALSSANQQQQQQQRELLQKVPLVTTSPPGREPPATLATHQGREMLSGSCGDMTASRDNDNHPHHQDLGASERANNQQQPSRNKSNSRHQQQQQQQEQKRGKSQYRRRSISMWAGLNYWHYYYYLRNNSLDNSTANNLPSLLAGGSSGSGLGGDGPGAAGGRSGGADGTGAPVGPVGSPLGVGGGTPMSESERRTRLYINYSLARLDILNCHTDPVARLAEKLAKAAEAAQQELRETGNEMGEQQPPVWDRLFDFDQSSDVSLTLSTSSTCVSSSSCPSRNSSSLSSPVSTVSSLAIGFQLDTSTTTGTTMDEHHEMSKQELARLASQRRDSLGSAALSSSQASLATIRRQNQAPVHQQEPSSSHGLTFQGQPPAQPAHSLSSHSIRTSAAGLIQHQQLQLQQPQHQQQLQNRTHSQLVLCQDQACERRSGLFVSPSQRQQSDLFNADLLPGPSWAASNHQHHQQQQQHQSCQSPTSLEHQENYLAAAATTTKDCDNGGLPQTSALGLRSFSGSMGNFIKTPPGNEDEGLAFQVAAPPPTYPRSASNDQEEDDFARFSRMNQAQGPGKPVAGRRCFERDAHFRFSVKSNRSNMSSSSKQSIHQPAQWHESQMIQHNQSEARPQQQQQWQPQPQQQQSVQDGPQWWGSSISEASSRRHARTFLSWDRLEIPSEQQQQQQTCFGPEGHQKLAAAAASKMNGRDPQQHKDRKLRDLSLPLGQSRHLSHFHSGGSVTSTSSGFGHLDTAIGDRQDPMSRRSFRRPKRATEAVAPSSEGSGVGGGRQAKSSSSSWCSSYFVSQSKSFLFQRRSSSKRTTKKDNDELQQQQRANANDDDNESHQQPQAAHRHTARVGKKQQQQQHQQQQPPRDEQREEADKLLEQFEAQMSRAANLAAASGRADSSRQRDQQQQADKQPHESHRQQRSPCGSKSGPTSRSSASSSVNSTPSHSSSVVALPRTATTDHHHHHQLVSSASTHSQQQQQLRNSTLCLDSAGGMSSLMPSGGGGGQLTASLRARSQTSSIANLAQFTPTELSSSAASYRFSQQAQLSPSHRPGLSLTQDSANSVGGGGQQQKHAAAAPGQPLCSRYTNEAALLGQRVNWPPQQPLPSNSNHQSSHQLASDSNPANGQMRASLNKLNSQNSQNSSSSGGGGGCSGSSSNNNNPNESFDGCARLPRQTSAGDGHPNNAAGTDWASSDGGQANSNQQQQQRASGSMYKLNYRMAKTSGTPKPPMAATTTTTASTAAAAAVTATTASTTTTPINGFADNELPRARAHSTGAGAEPVHDPINHHDHRLSHHNHHHHHQLQHQQQLQQHGRIKQQNAISMLTLRSLACQTAQEVRGAQLSQQLAPSRLLASDGSGDFLADAQRAQPPPRGRSSSARSSTMCLAPAHHNQSAGPESAGQGQARELSNKSLPAFSSCLSPPGKILATNLRTGQPAVSSGGGGDNQAAGGSLTTTGANRGSELNELELERTQSQQEHQRSSRSRGRSRQEGPAATGGAEENLCSQALSLLRKNSFTCTVLGARQTGKRTMVICFVKLLNEFKLAADECKKERMLTKLVECSERLHELTNEREQQQQLDEEQLQTRQRRTSRLNSWLPGGGAVKHLLNMSPVSKRRLHSVVGPLLGGTTSTNDKQCSSEARMQPHDSQGHQAFHRRHTAFEPPSFKLMGSQQDLHEAGHQQETASGRYLNVHSQQQAKTNLLSICNNKSDTNINYRTTSQNNSSTESALTVHQLQVPSLSSAMLRKHSDPTAARSSSMSQHKQQDRETSNSPDRVLSANGLGDHEDSDQGPASASMQRRLTTNASSVGFLGAAGHTTGGHPSPRYSQGRVSVISTNHLAGGVRQRLLSSSAAASSGTGRPRRQSICLSRRKRRVLLSLKELNRRKFAIKFNTRRQISESFMVQIKLAEKQRANTGRRRSTILQLTGGSDPSAVTLPDALLVVYSISDRDSFEYAKSMIEQLRSLPQQQDIAMPIVLVGNKSDLERNREVKSEDGRAVAKRHSCKFIEISCTIGYNLDNLLVGLRTQLVLKHHIVLNSILRLGFRHNAEKYAAKSGNKDRRGGGGGGGGSGGGDNEPVNGSKDKRTTKSTSDNILVRFYKRYVMDNSEHDYDCDNFSKL